MNVRTQAWESRRFPYKIHYAKIQNKNEFNLLKKNVDELASNERRTHTQNSFHNIFIIII